MAIAVQFLSNRKMKWHISLLECSLILFSALPLLGESTTNKVLTARDSWGESDYHHLVKKCHNKAVSLFPLCFADKAISWPFIVLGPVQA